MRMKPAGHDESFMCVWLAQHFSKVHTNIHTETAPQRGTYKDGANERLMGQQQELKDQKPESSVEHEIKSSSTSEAGQLPADSHDRKQLETDPPDRSDRRLKAGSTPKALVKKHS
jgi:hypothetical protein